MRTVVVSDLHLGAQRATDVLRRPGPLAAFCAHLRGADRLVLLGDTVELRHGPARVALAAAEPVLAAFGGALGSGGEIVLVPGNHDHGLLSPWLRARGARRAPRPLVLDETAGPRATPAVRRLAAVAGPAALTVRYPGLWLRQDVYATHGHYLDCLTTMPAFERLGAGLTARLIGPVPEPAATPDDFEARLAPMYAWLDALAETRSAGAGGVSGATASAWEALSSSSRGPLRARALAGLFPLGILGLNRVGIGPLKAELSGEALRDAGLSAMGDALTRLGVAADHVIFGHTHRAGPLPDDDPSPWRTAAGTQLHNTGCWTDEPLYTRGGPQSPYWAGRAIELDDAGPPRLVRVVEDLGTSVAD